MSFPRYPKYKASGVEWLGDVPVHWDVKPLKYSTLIYTGNSLNESEKVLYESTDPESFPYISSKDIDLETHEVQYENGLKIPKEKCNLKVAESGTFLLCIEGGSAGRKVALLNHDVCFVNKLCCFSSKQNNKFRFYFSQTQNFKDKFGLSLTGLIGGVSTSLLKNFQLPTPANHDQTAIAQFLDRETGKIDKLVAEQRRLMELLKEKRQAVISHAVTKGINPNAPMKPSGIKWLGDVPEGWEIASIKHYAETITDGAHISPDTVNGIYPFVSTKDTSDDLIDFDNCLRTSEESFAYLVRTGCKPLVGDVLFSKDGTIGRTVVVKEDRDFVVASSLIIIRPKAKTLDPDYLNYLCQSGIVAGQVESFVKGAGLPRLSIQNLVRVLGCFPPLARQKEVASFLGKELSKFYALTAEAQRAIVLLQERRTALISAAVTGQIDVCQPTEN
ncbi:restriction endonuclease subunit S [Rhodoferax sp.]|uniref:restriction endonuclease subunit S n=1 Tax=Rhodoferax sp. TaxID=50421 RepID=UPI002608ED82|nr:restriction endonuclease subunit S [Rhodoferax sp.]MDD2919323.1 restriction endonuclease subunit S [Rhodoferax sp.]